ncbi:MAG: hypothetical protein WAN65_05715 [Candidatus Sulfotelmatobacter sp.]
MSIPTLVNAHLRTDGLGRPVRANIQGSQTLVDKPTDGLPSRRKILQAGELSQATVLSDIAFGKSLPNPDELREVIFSVVAPPSVLVPKPNPGEISRSTKLMKFS